MRFSVTYFVDWSVWNLFAKWKLKLKKKTENYNIFTSSATTVVHTIPFSTMNTKIEENVMYEKFKVFQYQIFQFTHKKQERQTLHFLSTFLFWLIRTGKFVFTISFLILFCMSFREANALVIFDWYCTQNIWILNLFVLMQKYWVNQPVKVDLRSVFLFS